MPRPRAPVPPDPTRLARLLGSAREARRAAWSVGTTEEGGLRPGRGWVPAGAPDDGWAEPDEVWPGGRSAADDPEVDGPDGPDWPGLPELPDGDDPEAGPGRHRRRPRVLTLPTPLRGAHVTVPWRAVVALLVVVAVAGLFFAVRVARAQEAAAPQVVPGGGGLVGRTAAATAFGTASGASVASTTSAPFSSSGASSGSGSGSGGGPAASSSGPATRRLVVDVIGQVTHPGVVSVPDGSRVTDVLLAVGGALPGADVQRLNLARLVSDGEQLFVPRPGETPPSPLPASGGSGGGVSGGAASSSGGSGGSAATEVVDLNTATLAALDGLPGVGPVLAQRILDWRAEHGRFTTVDELGEVSGIGDKLLGQIRSKVRV